MKLRIGLAQTVRTSLVGIVHGLAIVASGAETRLVRAVLDTSFAEPRSAMEGGVFVKNGHAPGRGYTVPVRGPSDWDVIRAGARRLLGQGGLPCGAQNGLPGQPRLQHPGYGRRRSEQRRRRDRDDACGSDCGRRRYG